MLIKAHIAVVMIALVATPALAQNKGGRYPVEPQSAERKARDAQVEKDYKAALGRIPDQKPVDPWGNVRPAEEKAKSTR